MEQSLSTESRFCDSIKNNILQIAIGPHESTMLLKHYIVFQMEQIWSIFYEAYLSRYKYITKNSAAVWALSSKHANDIVMKCNVSAEKVFVMPLYIDENHKIPDYVISGYQVDVIKF